MNFSININLSKLPGAKLLNVRQGKDSDPQECIVIPVKDAQLFKGKKGVYMDLIGIELHNPQYKQTHFLKQNLEREIYEKMTDDQRKAMPIIGNMRPLGGETIEPEDTVDVVGEYVSYEEVTDPLDSDESDDLPF